MLLRKLISRSSLSLLLERHVDLRLDPVPSMGYIYFLNVIVCEAAEVLERVQVRDQVRQVIGYLRCLRVH